MSTKPREFEIEYNQDATTSWCRLLKRPIDIKPGERVKLIEHSAYDELVEVVKFYTDPKNVQLDMEYEFDNGEKAYGTKARTVLEKHGVKI